MFDNSSLPTIAYIYIHIYISINYIYSLEITYPLLIHMSYPFCIAILTLVAFPSSSKTRNPWEQPKPGEMAALLATELGILTKHGDNKDIFYNILHVNRRFYPIYASCKW